MATERRQYDKQFKLDAVRMAQENGRTYASVARDLGIHPNVLYKWQKQLQRDAEEAFPGKGKLKPEDEELRRLRRENALLKEERDILKKALAVFSKQNR